MAFLDGDDLCAGCGACCTDTKGLKLADSELLRLPAFAPLVTERDGAFARASWDGPCPYLLPDRRCGVFAQRPADCGAYPIDISSVGRRRSDGAVDVVYRFEAGDCPERLTFVQQAVRADPAPLLSWLEEATGSESVVLVHDPAQRSKTRVLLALHRLGVAMPLLRLIGKVPPRPAPPSGTDVRRSPG